MSGVDRGRLDVGWGTEGETFTMSWTERDGPKAAPPQRRGGEVQLRLRSIGFGVALDLSHSEWSGADAPNRSLKANSP